MCMFTTKYGYLQYLIILCLRIKKSAKNCNIQNS